MSGMSVDISRRIGIIRRAAEILNKLESTERICAARGGVSALFPERDGIDSASKRPVMTHGHLELLREGDIIRGCTSPIRSIKGAGTDEYGSIGIVLDDGRFLSGGGQAEIWYAGRAFTEPAPLHGVKIKKISMGFDHPLLLSRDGRVFSIPMVDLENLEQWDIDDTVDRYELAEIEGIPKIRKIRAGYHISLMVGVDGNLWVYGDVHEHFPSEENAETPTKFVGGVRNVFSGLSSRTTFIQKEDGKVFAAGHNRDGQCGVGSIDRDEGFDLIDWTEIEFKDKNPLESGTLQKISCSGGASFILMKDGAIFSCGKGEENGLGNNRTKFERIKTFEKRGERVLDFACGRRFSVFLTDSGKVYATGSGNMRQYFGEAVSGDEVLFEIPWRNSGGEILSEMISVGMDFKISLWRDENPVVFITEKSSKSPSARPKKYMESIEMPRERRILLGRLAKVKEELAASFAASYAGESDKLAKIEQEVAREAESLKIKIRKRDREIESLSNSNGVGKLVKEVGALSAKVEKIVETVRTIEDLRDNADRIPGESADNSEIITTFRFYHSLLSPINRVEDLMKFSGISSDETLELYRAALLQSGTGKFESRKHRAVIEKIRDIFRMYEIIRGIQDTGAFFEFFEIYDYALIDSEPFSHACSEIFDSFSTMNDSEIAPEIQDILNFIFQHFGISDVDTSLAPSSVSRLGGILKEKLQSKRLQFNTRMNGRMYTSPDIPTGVPITDDVLEEVVESFARDTAFSEKISFLVLYILSEMVESIEKRVASIMQEDEEFHATSEHQEDEEFHATSEHQEDEGFHTTSEHQEDEEFYTTSEHWEDEQFYTTSERWEDEQFYTTSEHWEDEL